MPRKVVLNLDNIPAELKTLRQWVNWRLEAQAEGKPKKVPYYTPTKRADVSDPATWCTFQDVKKRYESGGFTGVGFVFTPHDPYSGIDLDESIVNGVISESARNIIHTLNSYTEISPSGRGVKIIFKAKKHHHRCRTKSFEVYTAARYFTITGCPVPGTPTTIEYRQAELDAVLSQVFDDDIPVRIGKLCKNDSTFQAVWNRTRQELKTQSEYDLSIATRLHSAGFSETEIRDSLNEHRKIHSQNPDKISRDDYFQTTIQKAMQGAKVKLIVRPNFVSVSELVAHFPAMRDPIVNKIVRRGEIVNIISMTKFGKTWLVITFALSIATGRAWFGLETKQVKVLVLDNELHPETIASRYRRVAEKLNINLTEIGDHLCIDCVRGKLLDVESLENYIEGIQPNEFGVIVIDAFYKMLPEKCDENSNADIARLYAKMDKYAAQLNCAFVLIHHATKGTQSGKSITDVGAGAGAQSRACDTHLILRPHSEEGAAVLECVVRSFPPVPALALRWKFPVWELAPDLDPTALKQRGGTGKTGPASSAWTAEQFVQKVLTDKLVGRAIVLSDAEKVGISRRRAEELLREAEARKLVKVERSAANRPATYARLGGGLPPF